MTFATTARVFERPFGQGAGVSLVGNATASGASPLAFTIPGGATEDDIAVMGFMSINSIPNASGPTGGATWNELVYQDVSSSDYHAIWWKVLGGSEADWELTHSAGSDVAAAVSVFRAPGVDSVFGVSYRYPTLQPGWVAGHPLGFQVCVYLSIDETELMVPFGASMATGVDFHSGTANDAQVAMVFRDTTWAGDAVPIRCGGEDEPPYVGSANISLAPS